MRSYAQYCGLARSLDVVGDRWNLLIVRQLLLGPARFRDLVDGLPGVATNLLTERLRSLEAAGVLERRPDVDGTSVEYALTVWGAELREPIEGLIRWSTPLMIRGPEGDAFRPEWFALALPALLNARLMIRDAAAIELDVGFSPYRLAVSAAGVEVGPGDDRGVDATLRADLMIVLGLAAGALTLEDAQALGLVEIDGSEPVVQAVFAG